MTKNKHIVIIEDNEDLAVAVQETLTERGYTVSVAGSGEAGIDLIKNSRPSLLLLDTLLPGIGGMEVLDALVEYRKKNELSVIVLSNVDDPEELKRARAHNIDEYLIKTEWRMEDVISKIKRYL